MSGSDLGSSKVKQKEGVIQFPGQGGTGGRSQTEREEAGPWGPGRDFTWPGCSLRQRLCVFPRVGPVLSCCTQTFSPVGRQEGQQPRVRSVVASQPVSPSVGISVPGRVARASGTQDFPGHQKALGEAHWADISCHSPPQPPHILIHRASEEPGPSLRNRETQLT